MNQPNLYSKHNNLQKNDNAYVIENYLTLIKWKHYFNEKILDIGCGEGYTTLELLLPKLPKNFAKLMGCDLSEKMVTFARNNCNNPRVDFCQFNIASENVEFGLEGMFDHIFSFYCLHWVPDQKRAFENIYKLLRPGGDILLSFLATNPIFDVYENMSKNIEWAPYFKKEMVSPYHHCKNPDDVVRIVLDETGFENCQCFVENRKFHFSSWSQLKQSVLAVNPTIPVLSLSDRNKYIEDLNKELRKVNGFKMEPNNNDQKVPVEYKLIIVYACKPSEMGQNKVY